MNCTEACYAMPVCDVCHLPKKPRGRSAPLEMANGLCDHECPGYDQGGRPGHYWPSERSEPPFDGAPRGDAKEAAEP